MDREEPAFAAASQAQRTLFQPRLHGSNSVFAFPRADAEWTLRASESRDPDFQTFIWPGLQEKDRLANIASLLKEKAGYEVVWKGKWHLSFAANAAPGNGGKDWRPEDIKVMEERYGWSGWNPADAGDSMTRWVKDEFGTYDGLATLGGGNPNNDGRYVSGVDASDRGQTPGVGGESTVEFLKNRAPKLRKPFCLFVSLVNPHDVGVFPGGWQLAGYQREAFANMGIELPPNYADDLSRKPKVQKAARDSYNKSAPLNTQQLLNDYVNFYTYLHTGSRPAHHHRARRARGNRVDGQYHHSSNRASRRRRLVARYARESLHSLRGNDSRPADRAQPETLSGAARDRSFI
jgi:Sulfatase